MPLQPGFTALTAAHIQDAGGNPLLIGTLEVLPTDDLNRPYLAATATAQGGLIVAKPYTVEIINGAIPDGCTVFDTSLTVPQHLCYRFTVTDESGAEIAVAPLQQPSGATFSLDTDVRLGVAALTPIARGPIGLVGPQGVQGVQGVPGRVDAGSISGNPFGILGKVQRTGTLTATSGDLKTSTDAYRDHDFAEVIFNGPGFSVGNEGGWDVQHGHREEMISDTRGIAQHVGRDLLKRAIGDAAAAYLYVVADGGVTGQSDEGVTGINVNCLEADGYFHGTCATASANQPALTFTSSFAVTSVTLASGVLTCTSVNRLEPNQFVIFAGFTGSLASLNRGAYVLTASANSFTVAAPGADIPATSCAAQATLYGNPWVTDGAFLLNISKGTLAGALSGPSVPFTNGVASDGSALPTWFNMLPVSGVTLPLTTAWGVCSSTIPAAATPGYGATRDFTVQRTIIVTLGQVGGSAGAFTTGSIVTIAGHSFTEQVRLTVAATPDTPATGPSTQQLTFSSNYPHTGGAVIFQGGIQGNYLSFDANLALSGMRSTYYVYGSLDGTHMIYGMNFAGGAANGTILPQIGYEAAAYQAPAAGQPDRRGFHLFPGAEIMVVPADTPLSPLLEPNRVNWQVGDVIENPHHPSFGGHGAWIVKRQNTPANAYFGSPGLQLDLAGPGINQAVQALLVTNNNPRSSYTRGGGPLVPPVFISVKGSFSTGFEFERPPDYGFINIKGIEPGDPTTIPLVAYQYGPRVSLDTVNDVIIIPGRLQAYGGLLFRDTGDGKLKVMQVSNGTPYFTAV